MEIFSYPETWIALLTLTILEIILGVDNIIFISIVSNKLPENQQQKSRMIGLTLALAMRIGLLAGITWIIGFTKPLFVIEALDYAVSVRDIILLLGGLFLIMKSTLEIGRKMKGSVWIRRKLKSQDIGLLSYRLLYSISFSRSIRFLQPSALQKTS